MIKMVSHILFSLIIILGLMVQIMMTHHHHNEEICFVKDHTNDEPIHNHDHTGCCSHEHENQTDNSHEQEDEMQDCCFIKNLNYVNPQTKKDNIKIKEVDIRFLSLFVLNESSNTVVLKEKIPEYEPPEQIYPGYLIVQDCGFRGPPVC